MPAAAIHLQNIVKVTKLRKASTNRHNV